MNTTTERVPFNDFHSAIAAERADLQRAFDEVLDSGWLVLGTQLRAFESEWAEFCGVEHAVGVGNGLDAIALGLRALGVGPGDEVITSAHTYIATWLGIEMVGATIVPVDATLEHGLMDLDAVRAAITERTKCILPVHLYGHPENMLELRAMADEHGIALLDDAAQAHAARIGDSRVGSLADITAFSFYPSKNLGALGDGGAITTNSADLADRVAVLRNYGSRKRYHNEVAGTNSRLDELQAAFLRTRVAKLEDQTARRAEVAAQYATALEGTDVRLVQPAPGTESCWHLVPVWTDRRDELASHLAADGIDTIIHYPIPPHRSEAFAGRDWGSFPVAEQIAETTLSLPIGPYMTDEQSQRVVASLIGFVGA